MSCIMSDNLKRFWIFISYNFYFCILINLNDKSCKLSFILIAIDFLARLIEIDFAISKPVIFLGYFFILPSGKGNLNF